MKPQFVFSILISVCLACQNDGDCSNHGQCQSDNKCYCKWFYEGENCGERWTDENPGWFSFFVFYCAFTCVLHACILAMAFYYLKPYLPKLRANVITIALMLVISASTLRLLEFAADGHNYWNRWPSGFDNFLYYVPGMIWFFTFYLLMHHWIRLTQDSNLVKLRNFKLISKYVIVMQILTIVILLPGIIWESITPVPASIYFLNFCLVVLVISCISIALFAGYRLLSTTRDVTADSQLYYTLKLKTNWVLGITIPFFCFMITGFVFTFENVTTRPWEYVILNLFLRVEEFVIVFCGLQILSPKPLSLASKRGMEVPSSDVNKSYS